MSTENSNILDLDAYLDTPLDAIPDLPSYVVPPAGSHRVTIRKPSIDGDKGSINITFGYLEAMELADPEAAAPKEGSLLGENYRPGKENPTVGLSRLKKHFEEVMAAQGWTTIRELLDGMEGLEVAISTKVRNYKDKDGNDASAMQLVAIAPL